MSPRTRPSAMCSPTSAMSSSCGIAPKHPLITGSTMCSLFPTVRPHVAVSPCNRVRPGAFVDQAEPILSFQPSFEGHQQRLCPCPALGFVALPQVLFRLLIPFWNSREWFFTVHDFCLSAPCSPSLHRSFHGSGLSGVGFPMACLRYAEGSDFRPAPLARIPVRTDLNASTRYPPCVLTPTIHTHPFLPR